MADSKDKKDESPNIDPNDLDEMLNQAKNQIEEEIDEFGEDAVDQLLVKDDFAENDLDTSSSKDSTDSSLARDMFADSASERKNEGESSPDDLVMDEFDISSIKEESSASKSTDVSTAIDDLKGQITQADELLDKVAPNVGQEKEISSQAMDQSDRESRETETAGIHAQISQIWADNEDLKMQIGVLASKATEDSTAQESLISERVDELQKRQQKLTKSIQESSAKPPMLTYVALGLGLLSLLTGGIMAAMGSGSRSEVAELTELVGTLEEEIEILSANGSKEGVKQLDEKIKLLVAKDDFLSKKLDEANNDSQTTFLKPVIDDLVKQTDSSKQSIELLVSKVEKLEKNKPLKVVKRKRVKKKGVAKSRWVVNLVAFRQKWYAANKLQEFKKKGVPADLIEVKVKGEKWYRLRVKGFKSKEKATTYSVDVKKKLNLGSVWVTKG